MTNPYFFLKRKIHLYADDYNLTESDVLKKWLVYLLAEEPVDDKLTAMELGAVIGEFAAMEGIPMTEAAQRIEAALIKTWIRRRKERRNLWIISTGRN